MCTIDATKSAYNLPFRSTVLIGKARRDLVGQTKCQWFRVMEDKHSMTAELFSLFPSHSKKFET